ncbi:hypothetical protein PAECIP111891_07049 [Paenibacillus allorhizoplanae]|uniref:DUF3139 domain-containing protein n=1 Tax=Paenibacillus allorhizoplanae TaxID=2905648 RepID=A0ABM9D1P8_9BACL|nr:hypothetical protein [Paenibacillus allorhizoplanae]CAH1232571.1 hypothetical protein PAECIP111891_07049 [Paenibacillus allorhizoplanae]
MNKKLVITICIIAPVILILSLIGRGSVNNRHKTEIQSVIGKLGGQVSRVESVDIKKTPIKEGGKGNVFYKITYSLNGKENIAWYRAIINLLDIHTPASSKRGYPEQWIFPKS